MEAITLYLNQRSSLTSDDFFQFCACGGKRDCTQQNVNYCAKHAETIDAQQKQLEVCKCNIELLLKTLHNEIRLAPHTAMIFFLALGNEILR